MNYIKSMISKLMATLITCAICIVNGVPVHAEEMQYISDVKMAIAKGTSDNEKNDAIKELEADGYTVLKATTTDNYETSGEPVNINAGTDTVPVYLGYKTTTDSSEAITDIKMIEMADADDSSAAYSFTAYDELVKKYKSNIEDTLSALKTAIAEFASNYDAGSPAAKWSYENLNLFNDPETDSAMGDVIMDFGRQIADQNEDADLDSRLTNYLLKSNTNFVSALNSLIAVGCAEYQTDSTWIERFAEMDPEETYAGEGYDEAAGNILDTWSAFYNIFNRYQKAGLTEDSTDDALNAYFKTEESSATNDVAYSLDTFLFARKALQEMDSYTYNDQAMSSFFMQADNGSKLDKQTVLPLVASLTDGQRAMVSILGIRGLFSILDNTEANWNGIEASVENILKNCEIDTNGRVSIYEGVNFSLYDQNGIALTSDAMVRQSTTSETPYTSNTDLRNSAIIGFVTAGVSMVGSVIGFVETYIQSKAIMQNVKNAAQIAQDISDAKFMEYVDRMYDLSNAAEDASNYAQLVSEARVAYEDYRLAQQTADFAFEAVESTQSFVTKAQWIGYGLSAALLILSIGANIWSAYQYYGYIQSYYHPSYTQIPGVMIDNLKLENTSGIVTDYYVYYKTVMYNNDGSDQPADTNGFTGKKWNAMFTTTDKNAGSPIVANTLCAQIGTSEKENYTSVTKFHQSNAYNLNAHQFTDNANGIYLFYQDADNPNLVVGSIFSAGMIGGVLAGTAGGIVIGALGMMFVQKKKKQEAEA